MRAINVKENSNTSILEQVAKALESDILSEGNEEGFYDCIPDEQNHTVTQYELDVNSEIFNVVVWHVDTDVKHGLSTTVDIDC